MVPCGSLVHRFAVCLLCFSGGNSIVACQLDSLKEDEMLRAVLHMDHVRENLLIVLLANHIVCKRVLLASVKSYIYVHVVRVS